MKRVLARMSALTTVVVLGLIAIAQAQRSQEDAPPGVSSSGENSGVDSGASEDGASRPAIRKVNAGQMRRLLPPISEVNPLRTANQQTFTGDVTAASSQHSQRYRVEAGGAPAPASTDAQDVPPAGSAGSAYPFVETAEVAADGRLTEGASGQPGAGQLAPPERIPFSAGSGEPLPETNDMLGPAPPNRSLQEVSDGSEAAAPIGRGLDGPAVLMPGSGEPPGRFEVDPNTASSSLPSVGAGGADRYRFSQAEAPADLGLSSEGTGTPGNTQLEGPQTPQLTIQKLAPAEVQVGKAATFRVKVANTGQVAAHGVEIRDEIPRGARLMGTSPQASQGPRGELVWTLGTVRPGEEASVELQLMPTEEGEIGSVATVHFSADASVRTVATKPELALHSSAPSQVLIGEEVTLTITISNPGSGVATGVVLWEKVPPGLEHPEGDELDNVIGDLKPKESRQLELTLRADRAGLITNVLTARADGNLEVDSRLDIEVVAPRLDVSLEGPKRRFLEREATYTLSVSNPGTAPARNVQLVAFLPEGLEFVDADNYGHYEAASRSVHWSLKELPVQEAGGVRLTTMPVEAGDQVLRFSGSAERGLLVEGEQTVRVEGIAMVLFQIADVEDPIELAGETTYEIRVVNEGTKAGTNVQLAVIVPPEMRPVAAEGPVPHAIDGNRVLFEALPRLAPRADTTYRVRVQGLQPGDLRLRVQLLTDEMDTWVTKEEGTRVYADE